MAVIRLSVPRHVEEALPRFQGVPIGDSIKVGRLIADTIQIRADELLEAVEQCPVREAGEVADMRCLIDQLDRLALSYERLVGESEPLDGAPARERRRPSTARLPRAGATAAVR